MLSGKTIVLGITGGIAAYKIANLASLLVKQNANVHVIMTENAQKFITPYTFDALTHNRTVTETFDRSHAFEVEHVELAKKADLILVAPATANVIGKMANGIADDMLTTTILASRCKVLVAPAMNTGMYENQIVQRNLQTLKEFNIDVIEPNEGNLACGDVGMGKMEEPEVLLEHIIQEVAYEKDMEGLQVLVTAGATRESLDPVRFITNHSTGKMGYAIARACKMRGADVTLITGITSLKKPLGVTCVDAISAKEMYQAVDNHLEGQDIIIKAAAVADYRPAVVNDNKIKKNGENLELQLEKTQDILKTIGDKRTPNQYICGFSMETENLIANSRKKLQQKKLDMIIANNLKEKGAGFGVDTNVVTVITKNADITLPLMSKDKIAFLILNEILSERK